jgi:hypothetical protein
MQLSPPGGGTAITLVTWFPTMPGVDEEVTGQLQDAEWGARFTLDDPDGNGIVIQERS